MQKHITLIIHQKLEIIGRFESGKSQRGVMISYNIASSTIYDIKKQKNQIRLFMVSSNKCTQPFQVKNIERA